MFSVIFIDRRSRVLICAFFCFLIVYLIFFTGLKSPDVAPDYYNYSDWLHSFVDSPQLKFVDLKDPGFLLPYSFINWIGFEDYVFFCLVASVSLLAKARFSSLVYGGQYSFFIFFLILSRFYIVHDLVQIRVGAAIAIASCAIMFLNNGSKRKGYLLFLISLSIHLSVIILFPIYLFYAFFSKYISKIFLLILIFSSFMFPYFAQYALSILSGMSRVAPYINGEYQTSAVSLFSFYFMVRLLTFLSIVILLYERLAQTERFLIFMSICGVAIQAFFSWNDAFSLRFSELFGLFDMASFCIIFRFIDQNSRACYALLLVIVAAIFYISSLRLVGVYSSLIF
ncbi:EpsG family protein [Pseudomonas sp. EL_65y_Pfl2_R95]|uniref:EpsG family protein n=1 Tax=Pseudomonas sp. EL_65y_Pfl2_R95 TaxID=3088698 RepID=UPI0040406D19